jgi:hypothetical protein
LSDERLILRERQRAVAPFGGLAVFLSFLGKIGLVEAARQHMQMRWKSPNHLELANPNFAEVGFRARNLSPDRKPGGYPKSAERR